MPKSKMFFEARASGAGLVDDPLVPTINPDAMTPEERLALVRRIEAREVYGLRFAARAFGSGPNRNNARLRPEQIDQLAATAASAPLVTDHAWEVGGIVGEVLRGEARDEDGERALYLMHELTEREAMVAFTQRRLRRFSVAIEADDWQGSASGGEIAARGNVRLLHNAFVSEPAYERAGVAQPFHQARSERMSNTESAASAAPDDQAARIAELEAALQGALGKIAELEGALGSREEAAFSAAFDCAVAAGAVKPAARERFAGIFKAAGLDATLGILSELAPQGALPTRAVGVPAPATRAAAEFDARAAANLIIQTAGRKAKTTSEEG